MIKGRPLGVVWVAVLSSQPKSKEERPVNSVKYVAMDVHPGTSLVVVRDAEGKVVAESVLATEAATILDFVYGLRGTIYLTFEEGTHSAWLYDLLVGHVDRLVVCNPRQNALLKAGNKSDRIDARKLSELLRAGLLSPVYHGENSAATLKQLACSYSALTEDTAGDEPAEGHLSQPGDPHERDESLREAAPPGVAGPNPGPRPDSSCPASLPGVGQSASVAPGSAPRVDRGVPAARRRQVAALGSLPGSDSHRGADRTGADTSSFPHRGWPRHRISCRGHRTRVRRK